MAARDAVTGRQYLDRRVSFMAVILALSIALWMIFLAMFDMGHVPRSVMAFPVAGILLCAIYHVLMIRCPCCGKKLGHLARSLIDFSLLRFPKRIRFCPYCMIDFEDDLKTRR